MIRRIFFALTEEDQKSLFILLNAELEGKTNVADPDPVFWSDPGVCIDPDPFVEKCLFWIPNGIVLLKKGWIRIRSENPYSKSKFSYFFYMPNLK